MKSFVWKDLYSFRRFFLILYSTKIHFCTAISADQSYVVRISAHACVWSAIIIFISSLWIAFSLSEQLKINHIKIIKWNWSSSTLSRFKENQNTIEKNEYYEWEIWRTIMKTMNENNFICIKINSWFQYDRVSSAFFFIIDFVSINFFNSWFFSDQIRSDQTKISSTFFSIIDFVQINFFNSWFFFDQMKIFVSTSFYNRSHTDQHFNSWFFEINENFVSISFYRFIQINIWSASFFVATELSLAFSSINR